MIGPDAPGNKLTKKIASWFGGAYHTVAVPTGRIIEDKRPDAVAGLAMKPVQEMEYRMYLVPHADAETGIMCDAGNRLPSGCRETASMPYIVCNVVRNSDGKAVVRPGIQTIWSLETAYAARSSESLIQDDKVQATMKKLGLLPSVTEV